MKFFLEIKKILPLLNPDYLNILSGENSGKPKIVKDSTRWTIVRAYYCALLLFLGCKEYSVNTTTAVGPKIRINDTILELGKLSNDSIHEFIFFVHNDGDDSLYIDSVGAGCRCTAIQYPRGPILPNDSAGIIVEIKPSGAKRGKYSETIAISTNCKKRFSFLAYHWEIVSKL